MALDSREPLSGSGRDGPQKVSSDVLPSQLQPFTFVPVLKKLPIKSRILPRGQIRDPSATSTEQCSGGQEADQSMSDGMFRAEMVFIGDSDEGDAGAARTQRVPDELSVKGEAPAPFKMAADHLTETSASDRRFSPHTENTMPHFCMSGLHTLPGPGSTNHRSVPGQCQDVPSAPVDGICGTPVRVTLTSTTETPNSDGLLVSSASSRESVTWEDWAKRISQNSPEGSLASLSRTESPCSSIWSGSFSPCVVRVERRSLAPGCSLAQASATQAAGTLSSKTAHKIPPSRLSLLTAILRKGRLPLLSPTPTRPYSPCWPVTPESQLSCAACSAASSLCSLWQGPSRPQSPSPVDKRRLTVSTEAIPSPPPMKTMSPPPRLYPFQVATVQKHNWPSNPSKPTAPPQPSSAQGPATPAISQTPPLPESTPETLTHAASPPHRAASPLFSKPELVTLKPSGAPYGPVGSPLLRVTQVQESNLLHPLQNGIAASPVQHLTPPPWWSSLSLPLTPPKNPSESLRSSSALSAPGWMTPPPSPPLSLVSSPSPTPRDGTPDGSTVGGGGRKKKQYKIKTGYKVLAAIPTNTILLEQQAVDDHVENQERPGDRADNGEESHPEICSPAQLRQESEELYAAIDEVLENTMPTRRCRSVPVALTKPLSPEPSKPFTLLPRPVGRETKYAFSYTQQGSPLERNLTKPGVIRPVGAVTKTPEADNNAEFQPNPFRKYLPETSMGKQLEPIPSCPGLAGARGTEGGISPAKGTQVPEESGEALAGRRTPILRITKEDGSDIQTVLADSSEYPDAPASTLLGTQNETHI